MRFLIEAVWLQPENVAHSEIPELVNSGHGLHPLTQNKIVTTMVVTILQLPPAQDSQGGVNKAFYPP